MRVFRCAVSRKTYLYQLKPNDKLDECSEEGTTAEEHVYGKRASPFDCEHFALEDYSTAEWFKNPDMGQYLPIKQNNSNSSDYSSFGCSTGVTGGNLLEDLRAAYECFFTSARAPRSNGCMPARCREGLLARPAHPG